MALINIDTAIKRVQQMLARLAPPAGVEILTYKRNRGVSVIKLAEDTFSVKERGYEDNEHLVCLADLGKLLKSIAGREFPRSRKVRIYQLQGPDALGRERKKI